MLGGAFGWFPEFFLEVLTAMTVICGANGAIGAWKIRDAVRLHKKGDANE